MSRLKKYQEAYGGEEGVQRVTVSSLGPTFFYRRGVTAKVGMNFSHPKRIFLEFKGGPGWPSALRYLVFRVKQC